MDISKEIEKLNIQLAYPVKPYLSLKQILYNFDSQTRLSIAQELGIRLRMNLSKEKEISKMLQHMLDKKRIEHILLILDQNEYDLFLQLLEKDYTQDNALSFWPSLFMIEQKLLFSFYDEGKVFFIIPQEIKTIYSDLDKKQFKPLRASYQEVHGYLMALSNLYGYFERYKLVEIFNYHNQQKLSIKECNTICDHLCYKYQNYYGLEEFIISDYFAEENIEELEGLLEQTMDIPYYLPTKDDILLWEENDFYMTPQLLALQDYMVYNMGIDADTAAILVEDIDILAEMELPIQEVIQEFENRDIYFASRAQLEDIIPLIVDVYNHTRVWSNRGHTYAEIVKLTPRSIPNRFDQPVEALIQGKRVVLKVAKDGLCFCGSGKKYIHCCGSNVF
ncbi:MAG: YecA family protein [Actinomycetota bacterium]